MNSFDLLIRACTQDTLRLVPSTPGVLRRTLDEQLVEAVMRDIRTAVTAENVVLPKGQKFKMPCDLPVVSLIEMLIWTGEWINVSLAAESASRVEYYLAHKQFDGPDAGLWLMAPDNRYEKWDELVSECRRIKPGISLAELKTVGTALHADAAHVSADWDDMLVYCNNGVFDLRRRDAGLDPFTPYADEQAFFDLYGDRVRVSKLVTDYNVNAVDTDIVEPDGFAWNVARHMASVFDDSEVGKASRLLLWQIAQCAFRQHGLQSLFFFLNASADGHGGNMSGGNGKSGIVDFISNVMGRMNVCGTGILKVVDTERGGASLVNKMALLSTEENLGTKVIENSTGFKQLVRSEHFITRFLYGENFEYRHHGVLIQCANANRIRFSDTSESPWRGVHILRFEQNFCNTAGVGLHPKIVTDYIKRQNSREVLLKMALELPTVGDGYDVGALQIVDRENREDVKTASNPAHVFLFDFFRQTQVDRISYDLLWAIFRQYMADENLYYKYEKSQFIEIAAAWCASHGWSVGVKDYYNTQERNDTIADYYLRSSGDIRSALSAWVHPAAGVFMTGQGTASDYRIHATTKKQYRGIRSSSVIPLNDPEGAVRELMGTAEWSEYCECLLRLLTPESLQRLVASIPADGRPHCSEILTAEQFKVMKQKSDKTA